MGWDIPFRQPDIELGTAAAIIVLDPNTQPSNLIVDEDDRFSVAMDFTVGGLSRFLLGYLHFEVVYNYESIGGGPEGDLGTKTGDTVAGQFKYNDKEGPANTWTTLEVPPNKLEPGVYRLSSVVTFTLGPIRDPIQWPITGFTESPAIQVTP
jgi:hypothetical protein